MLTDFTPTAFKEPAQVANRRRLDLKRAAVCIGACLALGATLSACSTGADTGTSSGAAPSATTTADPQSADSAGTSTPMPSAGDDAMSAGYEVDPTTGKLLNPNRDVTFQMPEELESMRENSPAGALHFAEYFIDITDYAWNSGDASAIEAVSVPECAWCQETITQIKEFKDAGGWIENLRSEVVPTAEPIEHPEQPGTWMVQLRVSTAETGFYTGTVFQNVPPREALFNVELRRDADTWKVVAAGPNGE